MTGSGVFDRAKALQRLLVDRAALRDRRIARANASLQVELLGILAGQPDELVRMVHQALSMDRAQRDLAQCVHEAMVQRLLARGEPAAPSPRAARDEVEVTEIEVGESFAATFGEPDRRAVKTHVGVMMDPTGEDLAAMVRTSHDAQVHFATEQPRMVRLPDGRVVPLRYPDPGEPAVELEDGTLVALPAAE